MDEKPKTPEDKALALIRKSKSGISFGVLKNRLRGKSSKVVSDAVQSLIDDGLVRHGENTHPVTGRTSAFFLPIEKNILQDAP